MRPLFARRGNPTAFAEHRAVCRHSQNTNQAKSIQWHCNNSSSAVALNLFPRPPRPQASSSQCTKLKTSAIQSQLLLIIQQPSLLPYVNQALPIAVALLLLDGPLGGLTMPAPAPAELGRLLLRWRLEGRC